MLYDPTMPATDALENVLQALVKVDLTTSTAFSRGSQPGTNAARVLAQPLAEDAPIVGNAVRVPVPAYSVRRAPDHEAIRQIAHFLAKTLERGNEIAEAVATNSRIERGLVEGPGERIGGLNDGVLAHALDCALVAGIEQAAGIGAKRTPFESPAHSARPTNHRRGIRQLKVASGEKLAQVYQYVRFGNDHLPSRQGSRFTQRTQYLQSLGVRSLFLITPTPAEVSGEPSVSCLILALPCPYPLWSLWIRSIS